MAANRISRDPGKTKLIAANPGVVTSADDLSYSVQGADLKTAGKSNVDLLLDLESTGVRHIGEEKASTDNDVLLSAVDIKRNLITPRDNETSNSTQESLDSDSRVLVDTSEAGYGNTQKVCIF